MLVCVSKRGRQRGFQDAKITVANEPQQSASESWINPYFIFTMDPMTTPKVKGFTGSDELIRNHHLTLNLC